MEHRNAVGQSLELITENRVELIRSATNQEMLTGYAIVWFDPAHPGTQYKLPGGKIERIERSAVEDVLRSQQDIQLVYEHEESHLLGSKSTGTAFFEADDIGLKVTAPYDHEDPVHQNVEAKLRKKLIRGMSFQGSGDSRNYRDKNGQYYSYITKITNLQDCSFVHNPAYKRTTADFVRSEMARYDALMAIAARAKQILQK